MRAGSTLVLPAEHEERAAYLATGSIEIEGQVFESGRLVVFAPGRPVQIRAVSDARYAVLGGEPLDGPRFLWWNFVSSSKDRIEQAKEDWQRDRFGQTVPGDETEFIPLPPPRPDGHERSCTACACRRGADGFEKRPVTRVPAVHACARRRARTTRRRPARRRRPWNPLWTAALHLMMELAAAARCARAAPARGWPADARSTARRGACWHAGCARSVPSR